MFLLSFILLTALSSYPVFYKNFCLKTCINFLLMLQPSLCVFVFSVIITLCFANYMYILNLYDDDEEYSSKISYQLSLPVFSCCCRHLSYSLRSSVTVLLHIYHGLPSPCKSCHLPFTSLVWYYTATCMVTCFQVCSAAWTVPISFWVHCWLPIISLQVYLTCFHR